MLPRRFGGGGGSTLLHLFLSNICRFRKKILTTGYTMSQEILDVSHSWRHYTCAGCGYEIDAPVCCGDRFCHVCNHRSRHRTYLRLEQICATAHSLSSKRIRFITFTQQTVPCVFDGVEKIVASFRRLRQTRWWKRHATGGAYVVEVTFSEGKWHCHIHALIQGEFMPQHALAAMWKKVKGGTVVDIRAIKAKSGLQGYLMKYITKTAVPDEHRATAASALKHLRLFSVFGSWHDIHVALPKVTTPCPHCHSTTWYPDSFMQASNRWDSWQPPTTPG